MLHQVHKAVVFVKKKRVYVTASKMRKYPPGSNRTGNALSRLTTRPLPFTWRTSSGESSTHFPFSGEYILVPLRITVWAGRLTPQASVAVDTNTCTRPRHQQGETKNNAKQKNVIYFPCFCFLFFVLSFFFVLWYFIFFGGDKKKTKKRGRAYDKHTW